MAIRKQDNFDADTIGQIAPGFVANAGTWAVGTTNPVSGARSFGSTSMADGDFAVDTSAPALADGSVTIDQIVINNSATPPIVNPALRCDANRTTGYLALITSFSGSNTYVQFFKRVGSSYTALGSGGTAIPGVPQVGDVLHTKFSVIGSTLSFWIWTNSGSMPTTPSASINDSSVTAAGYPGFYNADSVGGRAIALDNYVYSDTAAPAFAAGTVTGGAVTSTTASLTATEGSGGSGTITHQWYRSTSSGTKGSAISGATGLTLTDTGLTASTTYWYTLDYTQAGTTVSSNQVSRSTSANGSVLTAGTVTDGTVTATSVSATSTDATGGTAPYSYQWFYSANAGTLGSAVAGQTTRNLSAAGLSGGTTGYYTLQFTDSVGAVVSSNQVALITLPDGSVADPWDEVIEDGFTAREIMRLMAAVMLGKSTGQGGPFVAYRDLADTKNRVIATFDGKDRVAVILDAS